MLEEKKQRIIDNYINGNISTFRNEVVSLSKHEMLELIEFWARNEPRHQIINAMLIALE
jgi:hypothetical protein